ncbi:ABC transporter ATP-binding protein [Helicobacter turcicus]|uniref:ABC transporter ATP-binding protein n=1 Tax=Helicobacter turcicus TaxID=2867412 RepID=A0ABS7JNK4_9HELI|nr:ABC transporter ATP-binding protein [Helicobacter turcicus]MBX7490989.1 ABC transporter ATP-binding protein [Helicobacter turcicus]MBX7545884.1 ABC transporter ATP-binding protein [Helicobacter turcicus]
MQILNINNLCFEYSNLKVFDNLNLAVNRGEFIVLLGDSGCGKSTLLRIIAGILKQKSGEIENKANGIGLCFQNSPLFPWLNLVDNVSFGLHKKPKKERLEIARKFLDSVGLGGAIFEKKYPYECSGGQKSRAFLAKILCDNKELILLDEPFSALDAFTKENMQNLVRNIWVLYKKTMILITHDVNEALRLGTRILLLKPYEIKNQNIIAEFSVNFTNKIGENNVESQQDFARLRARILELLRDNEANYII